MKFLLAFLILCSVAVHAQDTELSNYHSAVKLAFGVGDGSDRGTAYAEEYYYHEKGTYDYKTVYIKDTTQITITVANAEIRDAVGNAVNPATTYAHYRLDQDLWAPAVGSPAWYADGVRIKRYTAPLTFATMTLPDGTSPVGVTGAVPGVTQNHANKDIYYWRGSLDSVGDEYHTLNLGAYVPIIADGDYQVTDGKFWVFCVNPKTPCLTVRATGNGQFYTTPIKNYHLPKIFDQTTYFNAGTGTVTFELRNLYASDVRYRINGGSWVDAGANNVTLDQDDFSSGTNTLEYYYEGNEAYVKTRTIVKNPTHPSLAETHGNLLWGSSDLLTRHRARRAIAGSIDATWWNRLSTVKNENVATTANQLSGSRLYSTNMGVLICAFQAHERGNSAVPSGSGLDSSRTWAVHAKTQLLKSRFRIAPVGLEIQPTGVPIPSREIKDRGYYTIGIRGHLMHHVYAYDLLISFFRSDQHANGITPIEDYLFRDWMARWQVFNSCELGFYYNGTISGSNMWERATYTCSQAVTLAMPSYSTPWGGTSGWDGNTTTYTGIPYPDVGHTWKTLFIDEDHEIPGYPNPHQRARYENLFTDVGAFNSLGTVQIDVAWGDREAYSNTSSQGFPVALQAMIAKLHTGKSYPKLFETIIRGKSNDFYAFKYDARDRVGPMYWIQGMFCNSFYPEHSTELRNYILGNAGNTDNAIQHGGVFNVLYFDTTFSEDDAPAADVTPPTLTSATVNAQGNRLTLVYSEDVEDVDPAHYSLSTGNTLTALSGVGNTWQFTIASPIVTDTDVPTLSYTSGAGRTADPAGNLLATISARAVVNNSLESTPVPPRAGRRGRGANNVPAGR